MKLLLDTHMLIWALALPDRLTPSGKTLLAGDANEIYVSTVSLFEIAIKRALGRGDLPPLKANEAKAGAEGAGYTILELTSAHAVAVETMPVLHGDPFDRLLIAQALTEPMRLLTHDRALARYSDIVICFG